MQESIFEQLIREFSRAVDDVREKVVERPWFGEPVTGSHQPPVISMAEFYSRDHTGNAPTPHPASPYDQMCEQFTPSPEPEREVDRDIER